MNRSSAPRCTTLDSARLRYLVGQFGPSPLHARFCLRQCSGHSLSAAWSARLARARVSPSLWRWAGGFRIHLSWQYFSKVEDPMAHTRTRDLRCGCVCRRDGERRSLTEPSLATLRRTQRSDIGMCVAGRQIGWVRAAAAGGGAAREQPRGQAVSLRWPPPRRRSCGEPGQPGRFCVGCGHSGREAYEAQYGYRPTVRVGRKPPGETWGAVKRMVPRKLPGSARKRSSADTARVRYAYGSKGPADRAAAPLVSSGDP